eukprot:5403200-Karenia_brevis.AAC.1
MGVEGVDFNNSEEDERDLRPREREPCSESDSSTTSSRRSDQRRAPKEEGPDHDEIWRIVNFILRWQSLVSCCQRLGAFQSPKESIAESGEDEHCRCRDHQWMPWQRWLKRAFAGSQKRVLWTRVSRVMYA